MCYNILEEIFLPIRQESFERAVMQLEDFELYLQTLLSPADAEYVDNIPQFYDYSDEYQGCKSWYEYQTTWN